MSKFRHLLPEANLSNNSVTNVTVQLGATAFLPCKYRHLAEHQVSEDQVCTPRFPHVLPPAQGPRVGRHR